MSDTQVTTLDDDVKTTDATQPEKPAKSGKGSKASAIVADAGLTGSRKTIVVHQGEGAAGRDDLMIGVNGVMFVIKRGKPVSVPVEVVHVLENAVTTTYENGEVVDTPRFAFSVVGQ